MTSAEEFALIRRMNDAGFQNALEYAAHLEMALRYIADQESGIWGVIARQALDGEKVEG